MPASWRVSPRLLPAPYATLSPTAPLPTGAAITWRRFMPRHLCGRHHMTQDKHVRGARTAAGLLLGVLGLLACLAGCTGPNPLERASPRRSGLGRSAPR